MKPGETMKKRFAKWIGPTVMTTGLLLQLPRVIVDGSAFEWGLFIQAAFFLFGAVFFFNEAWKANCESP